MKVKKFSSFSDRKKSNERKCRSSFENKIPKAKTKNEKFDRRKNRKIVEIFIFVSKKSSKVKNAKETNNAQSKKKNKKLKETVESDEEIVSESDDETSTNGEVRLENLLSNEKLEIEEKNDVYKQRLERAKQYIEQIAQQGKSMTFGSANIRIFDLRRLI